MVEKSGKYMNIDNYTKTLLVPPVVIEARAPGPSGRSPSAWRQAAAAAATRGGSTARLRLAGRGGVIPARRYCEGMQQRRPCCS